MRNKILIIACLLLVSVNVYAQTVGTNGRQPRTWDQAVSSVKMQTKGTDYTDNTSVFTNLAVTGNQATGNAGYLTLTAVDQAGNIIDYYLWMDATITPMGTSGTLRYSSFPLLTSNPTVWTSFPYGDWRNSSNFASGYSVVGTGPVS